MMSATEDRRRIERAASGGAEYEVVGGLMLDETELDSVAVMLRPEHFDDRRARAAFETILRLRRDGLQITPESVAPLVVDGDEITSDDIVSMIDSVPHGLNATYHAQRVLTGWQRREFDAAVQKTRAALSGAEADVDELLHGHVRDVESVLDTAIDETSGHISELLLDEADGPDVEPITTSMFDLDVILNGGIRQGQMVTVGARTGVGKTAFCGTVALAAARAGYPVLYLSFEMTGREMAKRFRAQTGAVRPDDVDSLNRLAGLPIYVRESAGWTIDRVECEVRRLVRRFGIRLISVDYISLVRPRDARLPRHEQISDVSRSLKMLAIQCDIVVLAAQQLNRQIETREDKRPRLADLRESGSIEQDSDVVLGLDRPTQPDQGDRTKAKVHVLKHRAGETAVIPIDFDPRRTLFWCDAPGGFS